MFFDCKDINQYEQKLSYVKYFLGMSTELCHVAVPEIAGG